MKTICFSDSHVDSEVVYEWGPVTVEPYLTVPKYSLIKLETGICVLQTSIGRYNVNVCNGHLCKILINNLLIFQA